MNITKYLGYPALALTTISLCTWGINTGWPSVGWITPLAHASDITELRKSLADATAYSAGLEQRIAQDVKNFRDEWRCDELQEQLTQLLMQQNQGSTPMLDEQLRQVREKMQRLDCGKYEI